MANYNNANNTSQWYQELFQSQLQHQGTYGYPPYYPPPIQPGLVKKYPQLAYGQYPPIPPDPYFSQFYPPQMLAPPIPPAHSLMHPAMISPRFFADPTNPPKIKYDPKKFGVYQNSYLDQLKPPKPIEISVNPLVDDTTFTKTPKMTIFRSKGLPGKIKKPSAQAQVNNQRPGAMANRQTVQPNNARYLNDSKFNMLMEKQDAAMNKTPSVMSDQKSVKTSDPTAYINNRPLQDSRDNSSVRTESSVNQASKLPLLFNKKLNAEQQIELNKNLILLNKQQIEGVSSESEQTTKTIQENAKNVRSIVEKLGNTNSNSLNLLHLTNKSNAHKKQAEKVPSDEFIRSNEWADVTTKKGPFETIRKKQEKLDRVSKKNEYANMVKERNKERLRSLQSMSLNSFSETDEAKGSKDLFYRRMIEIPKSKSETTKENSKEIAGRLRLLRDQIRTEREELKCLLLKFETSHYRSVYIQIICEMKERITDINETLKKYKEKS